jgi:broad specificity phosphatase PhoE
MAGVIRIAVALSFLALAPTHAHAQSLVIFVRHAERADGGAGTAMAGAPADPLLSAVGEARALKLAAMLADSGIKAIMATEFHRTQDTGKPLAKMLGLTVESMPSKDTAALVQRLKTEHPRDVVLIIGHSNTLPEAIKAFGGPVVTMKDDEYDAMYVLNPATGAITLIRY